MATLAAQKVKLYKETYDFVERFNRDSTWRISLLNAIKKSGKKNHLGTPLMGYAWIIFKSSPQFAISHGFKLLDALRNQRFDEFATTLDDLFTKFWKRASDREGLEQEGNKYEAGEIERPTFVSEDEHERLQQIESMPEGPAKFAEYENFAQSRIEQFQTPVVHLGGETMKAGIKFPLKSLRLPTNISTGIKKFITRNLTPLRIASVVTGGIGGIIGYGATNTALGAAGGGLVGGSLPTLVKQRGFGQMVLSGFKKAGNAGGSFLSGISSSGADGGIRGGGFFSKAAGGTGKKAALLALLGFVLLAAFLVGFTPAPGGTGGTGTPVGGTLTPLPGGSCPDQAAIDINKKDPNTCKYFRLGVNIFDTNFTEPQTQAYISAYKADAQSRSGRTPEDFTQKTKRIIERSKLAGLNPVIALGYWRTESAFGQGFGCPSLPNDFETQLNCVLGGNPDLPINPTSIEQGSIGPRCAREGKMGHSDWQACKTITSIRKTHSAIYSSIPVSIPITTFDDLAETHGSRAPDLEVYTCKLRGDTNCDNKVNNNCVHTYNQLVEVANTVSACIVTPPAPKISPVRSSDKLITCPLSQDGSGSFRFICGTFNNPRGGGPCGHGNPLYYVACTQPPYAECPFSAQLKAAVDVRPMTGNGANSIVYLPYINGNQSVKWTKVKELEPISGGTDGYKIMYEADFSGKHFRLDLTHINSTINSAAQNSGDTVSTTKIGVDRDGGGHLHTALSVDGKWLDSISEAHLCSP